MTDQTIHQQVVARAIKDAAFRQAFVSNPKETLAKEYNVNLPGNMTIRVLEDTSTTHTIVLPPQEAALQELSDDELKTVAGALGSSTLQCPTITGVPQNCSIGCGGNW